jgi:hypothetical protein
MSTPLAAFGPGILIVTRTDVAIPAPVNVGFVQEFSIDVSGTIKELFGQNQYPLVAARSTIKTTGKFKAAVLSGLAWNAVMFGQSSFSTGSIVWNVGSTFTTSTSATTLQVGSSLTFEADLGITYAASGLPLQRVSTGAEATGKYSITTGSPGLYNFAAGDQGIAIKVTFTNTSGVGQQLIVTNQPIGFTPTFQIDYYTNLNQPTSKPFVVRLFSCVASKLMLAAKLEDFNVPEFDFSLFANTSGQVFNYIFPEVS